MKVKERIFRIEDIDAEAMVEVVNRQKDIFDFLDDYMDNFNEDFFCAEDDSFEILYKDGKTEYISSDWDGHKVRRNNILSMVYNNACTAVVYGNFEINEYGIVYASKDEVIAEENITEITEGDRKQ